MRNKRAKAIRKVLFPKEWHPRMTTYKTISHPKTVHLPLGGKYASYNMQFVCRGVRRHYQIAKRIYKLTGVMPNATLPIQK